VRGAAGALVLLANAEWVDLIVCSKQTIVWTVRQWETTMKYSDRMLSEAGLK
jgi:hypothetical protein